MYVFHKAFSFFQGTNRVTLNSLAISACETKAALLEERLNVQVNALIRGRSKDYDWIAKVLRSESGPANYARFQGLLETEINFYERYETVCKICLLMFMYLSFQSEQWKIGKKKGSNQFKLLYGS